MLLCRVEGRATSTVRHPSLKGWRLLVCQPVDEKGGNEGNPILCLDALGAGIGQVLLASSDGKSVREKIGDPYSPARYMSIALIDDPVDGAKEAVA